MKRLFLFVSLAISLVAGTVFAEGDAPKAASDQKSETDVKAPEAKPMSESKPAESATVAKKEMPTIEHIFNHLKEKYKLDEKQSATLREILTETREQAIADHKTAKTHEELVALGKGRIETMNQKIEKILNEDQLKEYRESNAFVRWAHERWEMKQEHKIERRERKWENGEQAPPPKTENTDK